MGEIPVRVQVPPSAQRTGVPQWDAFFIGAKQMLEFLRHMDTSLFVFFNQTLANPVFDVIMPFITDKRTWIPVWLITIVLLLWKGGRRGRWAVLTAVLAFGLADPLVSRILKPLVHRIRPCNVLEGVHLLVHKSRGLSMPSAHAANFFALAAVFSYFYRRFQWILWSLAFLVAYSRIAVGVHYPFDVLVGALVGLGSAGIWILILKKRKIRF